MTNVGPIVTQLEAIFWLERECHGISLHAVLPTSDTLQKKQLKNLIHNIIGTKSEHSDFSPEKSMKKIRIL